MNGGGGGAMADTKEEGNGLGREMTEKRKEQDRIRNICIVAHVDHGKTTLADHLIAAAGGGLVHAKLAGKLRYLDDRIDEQERGVTMKSSSISLSFKDHVINLIDSPGHVDFCSEVSSGVRLSDGAVVLVDACEGVHIQTHAVLRQAWLERLTPCLVLNKLDRLILELKLTPLEAYNRMKAIIGEVNNIINAFRSEKYLSDVDSVLSATHTSEDGGEGDIEPEDILDDDDEPDAFAPERGNVAFASAIDGCAFRIDRFADLFAAKLGANAAILKKALWGDYYYNPKTKKIVGKKAAGGKLKPMFVQFVLEPLWQVYEVGMQGKDGAEMLGKIIKSMGLKISPRDLQHKDPRVVTQTVVASWLPLADTVLSMVIDCLPSPITALPERLPRLLPNTFIPSTVNEEIRCKLESVKTAIGTCDDSIEAPCVAFVSKMVAVPIQALPKGEIINLDMGVGDTDSAQRECFLAFARVFSGVLSVGSKVYVLSALYDPLNPEQGKNMLEARVEALYMMMGRGLEPKAEVSAGNVVAIRGLGQHILKSGTLSTTPICWPFARMSFQAAPIVRVAIEPSDPTDMGALARGLRLLNRADPFVEVSVSASGEHVIAAAGEVHLERCIKDLKERFARIELSISPPLVEFRETCDIEADTADVDKTTVGLAEFVERITPNGRCVVRVYVTRLPKTVIEVLDGNVELLKDIVEGENKVHKNQGHQQETKSSEDPVSVLRNSLLAAANKVEGGSKKKSDEVRGLWIQKLERIWALGPHRVGPNILITPEDSMNRPEAVAESGLLIRGTAHVSLKLGFSDVAEEASVPSSMVNEEEVDLATEARNLESSVVSGFQLATASGPLCEEPIWGLAFSVEAFVLSKKEGATGADQYGPFSSQVMSAVKDACRAAVLAKRPRIVEALYFCEVVTPAEHLGSVYGVLGRRRARVLNEEMKEGTALFIVHAYMPVSESFGFADELRRKTSGSASPQLVLSRWEALLEDPFFVPRTEEEIEEFGDGSSVVQNTARKLIDTVRRRKGLPVEEKLVQFASKQRTRARKV